jgi:hypothetical protein
MSSLSLGFCHLSASRSGVHMNLSFHDKSIVEKFSNVFSYKIIID